MLLGIQGISGSPFTLGVKESATFAEKCVAAGPGLSGVVAGDKLGGVFFITAHDRYVAAQRCRQRCIHYLHAYIRTQNVRS